MIIHLSNGDLATPVMFICVCNLDSRTLLGEDYDLMLRWSENVN